MRSIITSVLLGIGALGVTAATPALSKASWLSEAMHRRYDPSYYRRYEYAPAYSYYDGPAYYDSYAVPYYDANPAPYYAPDGAYYRAPYYRTWQGERHDGRGRHEARHRR
jgi:hypothetical protein